ncbi:MAG TPA: C2 family cysteine protease [Polyangiaceae bacterium]|nr:C2 family cysteine protease [Polyangiaceae bacterium]
MNGTESIQGARAWRPDPSVDGQVTTGGPPDDPGAAARAARAAAADRYQAFVASGAPDASVDPCGDVNAPDHDFDGCRADTVPNAQLFKKQGTDVDAVDAVDVQQGALGDCHFLAPLAALASTPGGRAFIHGAVAENKNDQGEVVSWTVTLHQRMSNGSRTTFRDVPVTVTQPFARGHAQLRPEAGAREIWPLVVEKACAQYMGGYNKIARGGPPGDAMALLTGREPTSVSFGWASRLFHRYGPDELQNDLASGKMVVLTTNPGIGPPLNANSTPAERLTNANAHGLIESHAYFVTGVQQRDGKLLVKLGNPWARDEPDPVPFDEFTKWFAGVTVGSVP